MVEKNDILSEEAIRIGKGLDWNSSGRKSFAGSNPVASVELLSQCGGIGRPARLRI